MAIHPLNILRFFRPQEELERKIFNRLNGLNLEKTPHSILFSENKMRALVYDSPKEKSEKYPIIMVPSLINRHYILDLMPGKSLAEFLSLSGHYTLMVDWGEPKDEDRFLDLDHYVDRYLKRVVRRVLKETKAKKVILLGYCIGGILASLFASKYPDSVEKMVCLTTPFDFEGCGLLGTWAREESFDLSNLIKSQGNVSKNLLQSSFLMMEPTLSLNKLKVILSQYDNDQFLESILALESWGNDNVDFPGKVYASFIQKFYRDNALVNGGIKLNGQEVDLRSMKCSVLNVISAKDQIVPETSTRAIEQILPESQVQTLVAKGGHIGAIISKKSVKNLWPKILQFCQS